MTDRTGGDGPLKVVHWSTDKVAPDRRFATWAMRPWPSIASVFAIEPIGAFQTSSDSIVLGQAVLQYAQGSARHYRREAPRIRADRIDVLGISMTLDGTIQGDAAGRPFRADAGAVLMLDLARPSAFVLSTCASIQLAVPRALAEQHLGSVSDLHGRVVSPARAAFLHAYFLHLREEAGQLRSAQGPRLARVILDLLGVALGQGEVANPPDRAVSPQRRAAEQAIEAELAGNRLTGAAICAKLGISRTALFRLFEGDGGFQAYARRRRLDHVQRALADPANRDTIAALADRWGFSDAPHLTRLFRLHYGFSPSAFRAANR
jgi:AraC-like DNA-binding protein